MKTHMSEQSKTPGKKREHVQDEPHPQGSPLKYKQEQRRKHSKKENISLYLHSEFSFVKEHPTHVRGCSSSVCKKA